MSKKYLLLCNRHNSIYGSNWCLWWGERESKNGYTSDVRLAHRFGEEEIEEYDEKECDIPVPIDKIGICEEYEPKETYNKNLRVMIERGTLNELMGLKLKPLFQEEEIICPNCGSCDCREDSDYMGNEIFICGECDHEFSEDDL